MEDKNTYDGILYACAKGRQKEWARETLIMDMLYSTNEEMARYLKFQDISKLDKCDEETNEYYIYKFGYHFQIPKSEIDLYVNKKDNRLFIKEEGLGYAYDSIEHAVYCFVKEQINKKNLYISTNLNCEEYLIK